MELLLTTTNRITSFATPSTWISAFPSLNLEVIVAFMKVGVVLGAIMLFWFIRCKEDWKSLLWCYIGSITLAGLVAGGYLL